jgi:hypothetical protein
MEIIENRISNALRAAAVINSRFKDAQYSVVPWTHDRRTMLLSMSSGGHLGIRFDEQEQKRDVFREAANTFNDLSSLGAHPVLYGPYLTAIDAVKRGHSTYHREEIQEMERACALAGCPWGGGKTHALEDIVMHDLGGLALGVIGSKELPFDPSKLQHGDEIVCVENSVNRIYSPFIRECVTWGLDIHYVVNICGRGWGSLIQETQDFTYVIERLSRQYCNPKSNIGLVFFVSAYHREALMRIASRYEFETFCAGRIRQWV